MYTQKERDINSPEKVMHDTYMYVMKSKMALASFHLAFITDVIWSASTENWPDGKAYLMVR
jgi:hypothetical protein